MFRFADPEYLYLLGAILLLALIYVATTFLSRRRIRKFGDGGLLRHLIPNYSKARPVAKFVLSLLALGLLAVMIARPQFGSRVETNKSKGIEVVIAIDVSNSMLATDVSPNRLERTKLLVSTLVDRMENDKIAIEVFAGEAYPQLPITNDFTSAKMFLDAINTEMVTLQGTNLASAINLASKSFTDTKDIGKAIIVITDGEDHEEGAIEAAEQAAKEGMHVFVLGIGSPEGATIPTPSGPLFDNQGNIVRTRLDESICKKVAQAGKGSYIHVDNSNLAQEQLQVTLNKLQQKDSEQTVYSAFDEQFQAVALLVILLLLIEFYMLETQNPLFQKIKLFKK